MKMKASHYVHDIHVYVRVSVGALQNSENNNNIKPDLIG